LKANAKELDIPVHLAWQGANGKIVEEHGYWDNQPLVTALQELESQPEATNEETGD